MNNLFMMRFTMCLMFVCRASPYAECEHGKQCVLTKAAPDVSHRASGENATCQTTALEISIHALLELGEPLAAVARPTCQHYTLQGRTANQRRAQFKNTRF